MESAGTISQSEQGVWVFFLLLYFYLLLSWIHDAGEGLRRLVLTLAAASAVAAGDDDDGATGVQKKKKKTEKKKSLLSSDRLSVSQHWCRVDSQSSRKI